MTTIWLDNPVLRLDQESNAPSWHLMTLTAAIKTGDGAPPPTADLLRAIRGWADAHLAAQIAQLQKAESSHE